MRGNGVSRAKPLIILLVLLFVPVGGAQASSPVGSSAIRDVIYPSTSWAVGVVVPEGAQLEGGVNLRWEDAGNLTSVVTLPYISSPSGIVYAVMSVMTQDGSVIQVAAGVYPNSSSWQAYSWAVEGIQSSTPTYDWILNSSAPTMSSGDVVSLSIFRNQTRWGLEVVDESTGASIERSFPAGIALSFDAGDQEAFALESYSRTAADFQHMGNLTLDALVVDGRKVIGGFYAYSGWDPNKNPVFAVGSSGTSAPVFISLQEEADDVIAWSYTSTWPEGTISETAALQVLVVASLVGAAAAAVCGALIVTRRGARRPNTR